MSENCTNSTQSNKQPALLIGDVTIRNRAFLAPMSGVTDVPFRKLAWKYGAGMVVSEMVASEALTTGQQEMRLKAESAGLPIHIVQLAGRQAAWMKEATRIAEQAGAGVIDINMGCPSKRVTNGYSGSALMRDLDHAMTLIDAVLVSTDLPVTLKMRLGWDEDSINAPELAERAEQAGVAMITVHGRTRNQFYKGQADWSCVARVREKINVPLVVNGDISDGKSAQAALKRSGADAVMVGRATYGAPWLVGQIGASLQNEAVPVTPQGEALGELVCEHYESLLSLYGQELGIRNARKHLDWYMAHLPDSVYRPFRREIMTSTAPDAVIKLLRNIFRDEPPSSQAA